MTLFAACESGGDNIQNPEQPGGGNIPDDAYISIDKEAISFAPDGESIDIVVYSNYEWELTPSCDWVTTSITGGEANEAGTTVTLTADLTYDDREGSITFGCGKTTRVLVVSQSRKEVIIADENKTFDVPAEGGNVTINYKASVECEVIIPKEAQSWISIAATETRGLASYSTTLNVAESAVGERSAVVKVVAKNNSELMAEYAITQQPSHLIRIIHYTTADGAIITAGEYRDEQESAGEEFTDALFGDANIVSNTYEDGLGTMTFDRTVTAIGSYAFYGNTNLTSITIPGCVTSIGKSAFEGCDSLISVTIPDSVTAIGKSAFFECSWLSDVYITDIAAWCGISLDNQVSNPLYYAQNLYLNGELATSLEIPDSVTEIRDFAFYGCKSLESITIPDSVTRIGMWAFHECSMLTSVTIGNSVTEIGNNAFYYCYSLKSITIPDSITEIRDLVFGNCISLANITIPNSVTKIGEYTFLDCDSLTNITIPNSVTSIGNTAFYGCDLLKSITIPESVTEIGDGAFWCCSSLASVYCEPTTPPNIISNAHDISFLFLDNAPGRKIYVPTQSVDAYKSADYWKFFADDIVGYDF